MPTASDDKTIFDNPLQLPSPGDPNTSATYRLGFNGIANRTRWLLARVSELLGPYATIGGTPTKIAACNVASGVFTLNGHGLSLNQPVRLTIGATGGSVPTLTPVDTILYAVPTDGNNFGLATTSGGSPLTNLGGSFAGEVYIVLVNDALSRIFFPAVGSIAAGTLRALMQVVAYVNAANVWSAIQTFTSGAVFTYANSIGVLFQAPIARIGSNARYVKRPPVVVPDAPTTIDTSQGDVFVLSANSQQRILTVRQTTSPAPSIGESIRIISLSGSVGSWIVQREGSAAAMVTHPAGSHAASELEVRDGGGATPHWTVASSTNGTLGADAD